MESRRSHTMEVTIISAENLCMNGKPIRKDAYVVVHTQSCTKFFTTKMTTREEGGSDPSWNEKFWVDGATCITLEVQCKTWLGVRSVGAARIAVADFLGGFVEENSLQFLSYRLWDGKGRRNGVINFSVRVLKAPQPESSCSMHDVDKNLRGFGMQVSVGGNDSSGIVTGIPVFWNYPDNIPR
ncbi:BON1-associated protein 2 [Spatholobus suberectus]|nr:BON1-associated protein 2 [Spatholobus suberectus]